MPGLKDSLLKGNKTTIRITSEDNNKAVPKGATIKSKERTVRTEQIENGWLMIVEEDTRYSTKDEEYGYCSIVKKWYTEEDPLDVKLNGKSLADEFDS